VSGRPGGRSPTSRYVDRGRREAEEQGTHGAAGDPESDSVLIAHDLPGVQLDRDATPQPVPYQADMERRFGTSFAGVTAYVGQHDAMSQLGARGVAHGDVVAFADAAPSRSVVAHELTHVQQQRLAGRNEVAADSIVASDHPAEVEARSIASRVEAGDQISEHEIRAAPGVGVHRDAIDAESAGPPVRTMRVTAYYTKKERKVWIGNTRTELSGYFIAFRNGQRFATDDGIDFSDTRVEQQENADRSGPRGRGKTLKEWAGNARMVAINLGAGPEDSLEHDADVDTLANGVGDEQSRAGRGTSRDLEHDPGADGATADRGDGGVDGGKGVKVGGTGSPVWEPVGPGSGPGTGSAGRGTDADEHGDGVRSRDGGPSGGEPNGSRGNGTRDTGGTGDRGDARGGEGSAESVHKQRAVGRKEGGYILGSEKDGREGGVYGGGSFLQALEVPAGAAGILAIIGTLSEANIASFGDDILKGARTLLKKKAKNAGKAPKGAVQAFKDEINERIDDKIAAKMDMFDDAVKADPDWLALDDVGRASLRSKVEWAARSDMERLAYHQMDDLARHNLRLADELAEEAAAGGRHAKDMQALSKELRDEADEAMEARTHIGSVRKERRANEKGAKSFKEFDDTKVPGGGTMLVDPELAKRFESIRSYWKKETAFSGMKVYQRDDLIDPARMTRKGKSNLDLMKKGRAPIGPDGKEIELHHLNQMNEGPVVEVTKTFHQQHYDTIHINDNKTPSGISRSDFRAWKVAYWQARAAELEAYLVRK
jgi:hypothetical protein